MWLLTLPSPAGDEKMHESTWASLYTTFELLASGGGSELRRKTTPFDVVEDPRSVYAENSSGIHPSTCQRASSECSKESMPEVTAKMGDNATQLLILRWLL